jgi:hypothetical protein
MTLGARVLVPLDGTAVRRAGAPAGAPRRAACRRRAAGRARRRAAAAVSEIRERSWPTGHHARARRAAQDYVDDVVALAHSATRARVAPSRSVPPIPTAPLDPELADGPAASRAGARDVADVEVPVHGVLLDGGPRARAARHRRGARRGPHRVWRARPLGVRPARVGSTAATSRASPVSPCSSCATRATAASPRAAADVTAVEAARLHHVLVALDGSPESEAVLAPALDLARLMEAAVTLASVEHPRQRTHRDAAPHGAARPATATTRSGP